MRLLLAALDVLVCFLRKTWRPVTCFAVGLIVFFTAGAVLVNGIVIPLMTKTPLDLSGLGSLVSSTALLVGALMPFVLARSYEKSKGVEGNA